MPERKPFLLRLDPETMDGLRSWAADDLRSLNGQIEFLLRRSLRDAGRLGARGVVRNARASSDQPRPAAGAGSAGRPVGAGRNDAG